MKELIGEIDLWNRHAAKYEAAELYQGFDDKTIDDFEHFWLPAFSKRFNRPVKGGAFAANAQDKPWRWDLILEQSTTRLEMDTFAVECAGRTQGMMLTISTKRARLQSQLNQEIVYIDRLASAPWNRTKFEKKPKYRGVGEWLVGAAISLSVELEFKGRIGLHSLPASEEWYRDKCQMSDWGLDPAYKGLRYFEMTEQRATAFVSEHK